MNYLELRETGLAIPLEVTPEGWKTPEFWINLRKTSLSTEDIVTGLEYFISQRCGVMISQVTSHSRQSWVDPRGRLCVSFTVRRPMLPLPDVASPSSTPLTSGRPAIGPAGDNSSRPSSE